MPAPEWEVVIVGSGPVGLTLANLLGVLGVRTLVVERNRTTVQEPRAVSIDDESLRTMQAAGVIEEVQRSIVPGYGSHYYTPGRVRFAVVEPTGRPYGYPRRNAFRQPLLEQQLRDGLSRFGQVETRFGWSLERYDDSVDGVLLHLANENGQARTITARFLVGCDGAASRVRDQQGVQLAGTTFDERWLIVDLENNRNAVTHTEVFCDRRRPCITLPGPDSTRRFEFKLLPGELDEDLLAPAMVERLLSQHGADPGATIRRKVVYRFHARVAPRWSFGRVLLAGDAAHLTPPFAGQGMNSGIRDAHNLSWKLHAVLRGVAGLGLLSTYEQERKNHIWQMINLALRMGRVMAPPSWLQGWLTQTGFRVLNLVPAARDYVAQMKYKPPPRFHAGFILPDGRGRHSMVGRMLPQPMVQASDGSTMLLDELLGNCFTLMLRTTAATADVSRLTQPIWSALGVRRVVVVPKGAALPTLAGWLAVSELDGALGAALARYHGHALLLRPDHYVAAAIPVAAPDQAARAVEAMLAATWIPQGATAEAGGRGERNVDHPVIAGAT